MPTNLLLICLLDAKKNNVKAPTKLEQQNHWLSGYEGFKAGYKATVENYISLQPKKAEENPAPYMTTYIASLVSYPFTLPIETKEE
jgi:fructose-1,6-bisphosphatase